MTDEHGETTAAPLKTALWKALYFSLIALFVAIALSTLNYFIPLFTYIPQKRAFVGTLVLGLVVLAPLGYMLGMGTGMARQTGLLRSLPTILLNALAIGTLLFFIAFIEFHERLRSGPDLFALSAGCFTLTVVYGVCGVWGFTQEKTQQKRQSEQEK